MTQDMEDSSTNILDILNDDCIFEIFRRLDTLPDLLSMAEVCARLRMCAQQHFRIKYSSRIDTTKIEQLNYSVDRSMFRQVIINLNECSPDVNSVYVNRADAFLKIFGPMTKNLVFNSRDDTALDDTLFKSVVENCGRTLKALTLRCYDANFEQTPFQLEYLHTFDSELKNFSFNSSNFLKVLHITWLKEPSVGHEVWFMKKMPKLKYFTVLSTRYLTDDMVSDFISLNPQLEILEFFYCYSLTVGILKAIGNCVNLTELLFHDSRLYQTSTPDEFNENLRHLGLLKNLKCLSIYLEQSVTFEKLFDLFGENGIPIEDLKITFRQSRNAHAPLHRYLRTINTLKHLNIEGPVSNSGQVFEQIIKTQTALETFTVAGIHNRYDVDISMTNLVTMLKNGLHLKKITFLVEKIEGDVNDFERALFYAKAKRVLVRLLLRKKKIDIPVNVLDKNRKWIDVNFFP